MTNLDITGHGGIAFIFADGTVTLRRGRGGGGDGGGGGRADGAQPRRHGRFNAAAAVVDASAGRSRSSSSSSAARQQEGGRRRLDDFAFEHLDQGPDGRSARIAAGAAASQQSAAAGQQLRRRAAVRKQRQRLGPRRTARFRASAFVVIVRLLKQIDVRVNCRLFKYSHCPYYPLWG